MLHGGVGVPGIVVASGEEGVGVGEGSVPVSACANDFAMPKSRTLTRSSDASLMFAGLRSRWTMLRSCAASSAPAICAKSFVQELDAKLQEARRIYSGDRRTLREIEPQFKAATREMDRQYRARGYSAADLKTIKTNVQNLSTEWHNVATFFDQRISDSPRSERVIRSTIINSATDVLNVSSFKTNFPAVIAPSGAVRVNHLVDESGHQCEEWCYSKTLPGVDFSYTIDLPDIPIPWLHVHDWWHWHSKWWGGYPHVHTHWHTRWISLDITFNFTADMYFEMCASATGASIAIAGSACANVNGEGGCCIVEAVGLAGIRVFGDGAGAQGCEYGFGAALAFSCEVFGYDLVDVNIPIGRITVKGPCVVQCEG